MPNPPDVSVVIPALNASATLAACLQSVQGAAEHARLNIEILLMDNGSTDDTMAIGRSHGATVRQIRGIRVGALRNAGAEYATGKVLAFVDSDCIVPPTWLETALQELAHDTIGAVGGDCQVPADSTWVERAWTAPISSNTSWYVDRLASATLIIRKTLFDRLKGFDSTLIAGEDDDLSNRITRAGYKLLGHRDCSVVHLGYPKTLRAVARRQAWHGRSQIDTAESPFDKLLLLTHAFALSMMFLAGTLLVLPWHPYAPLYPLAVLIAVPTVAAAWKLRAEPAALFRRLFPLIVVYFWFFVGRSWGLVRNYRQRWSTKRLAKGSQ